MDNSQKPAYPWDLESERDFLDGYGKSFGGLTKREELAKENFAALLSQGGNVEPELEAYAKIAVKGADALLKELEETK